MSTIDRIGPCAPWHRSDSTIEANMDERSISFPAYPSTAGTFMRHLVAQHPDATMVVLGDRRMTYREVDDASRALAKGLLAAGTGKGTRVGVLLPNSPDWIVAWLAASRIGCLVALLNTYYKPRELDWVLRHADVQHLLTIDHHLGHDYLDRLATTIPELASQERDRLRTVSHPYLRAVHGWGPAERSWLGSIDGLIESGRKVGDELLDAVEREVVPADPMVIVYSSGSTSDPKGAVHSHGSVIAHPHNLWSFRDLRPGDALYTPMPLFWVGGLTWTCVAAMHAGACLVFEEQFEPGATLALIERERVTHVVGWPHVSKALAEHPNRDDHDLSSLRGTSAGLVFPTAAAGSAAEAGRRPNSLGMTESLGPHSIEAEGTLLPADKIGSFGRPVPGLEHRIVDPITGEPVAAGTVGELCLRGYSVMDGLYKRSRDEVFTADGWYRTGDAAFVDADGHLFYKGRLGDQIKSAGMNITPREVELVLEECDEVMLAFVCGVRHGDRGEDVAAVAVLRPGRSAEPEDLLRRLRDELASYKVPRHLHVVPDAAQLPWLESGKIDRRALQRDLEARFGSS